MSKFNTSRTDVRRRSVKAVCAKIMSEEDDSLVHANVLKTPRTKNEKRIFQERGCKQLNMREQKLQMHDKVSRRTNPIDEETETHYISKFFLFTIRVRFIFAKCELNIPVVGIEDSSFYNGSIHPLSHHTSNNSYVSPWSSGRACTPTYM